MLVRTPKDIGLLIRDRRKELELDQRELARLVGVSRQWIIDLERGKAGVALGLVMRTTQALGLGVDMAPSRKLRHPPVQSAAASKLDALIKRLEELPAPKGKRG